ncbi:MAG: xanthine dehydrogenase family protein molybdopterin-binding subunit [Burkholderiales bacterium]|nr:xanthine dehydrogenase family protein molybdopterin-binding subunit [Burkholderiales bacterium]
MNAPDAAGRFGSGRAVPRIEDRALLEGRGRFTDNVAVPGEAVIAFLRSPYAHARIVAIDTAAARAMPGVVGVFTGAELAAAGVQGMPTTPDFRRADGRKTVTPLRHALAHEFARYVGEAIAAVVAESREQARDALEAIVADLEELPAVVDARAARAEGAAVVTAEAADNIAAEMQHGNAAATEAAFARAAHRVALDVHNQRLAPSPMEPRSVVARFDEASGRIEVRISNQMPTGVAGGIAGALPGLTQPQVHVLVGDVGGGFGMKTGAYPEDIAVAHAARALKRPVRWQADRSEEFLSAYHGRDVASHAELALDAEGRVLALRVKSLANVGAYATPAGVAIQLLIGPWVSTSIYDLPTIDLHFTAVLTHTAPTGPYRGAGRPEAIYLIERLMDAAAREMKMDPAALRRRNMIRPEQMPYKNAMGQTYDSGMFEKIMDQGLALADWNGFAARREHSKKGGKLRGRGIATFLEWTSGNAFEEKVSVDVTPDGFIEIYSATQQMGQGIQTSYAQLAVDVFGVSIEKVRIVQGDTDRGNGFGSAGSRSLFTGGSAVKVGSELTVEHAKGLAAEALEAAAGDIEYSAGRFSVVGTDLGIDLFALAGKQAGARIHVEASATAGGPTWPNACHVCEVEIDPATGDVQVVAYASVNDIGRVVSPMIVRGQVDGGAVQGIGQALCERIVYDPESGQLVTGSFMDYAMPRAAGGPDFQTRFDTSIPCLHNALGAKGVGELGTIGATPAVMNAVADALAHAGATRAANEIQMPATSERVWQALQAAV